ncbi:MAG TPA: hypothetical protein ENJ41_05830 [Oceanospirillales bacterium]|nr:hypothetical protein [Oceanospirillales bacterium]
MKKNLLALLIGAVLYTGTCSAQLPATEQTFNNIDTLSSGPTGWILTNQSTPVGVTSWSQGNPEILVAQSGFARSYISANFNSTGGESGNPGIICNYLIMPDLGNLASVSFQTRSRIAANNFNVFPDRLYMVYSPTGGTNTGNCTDGFGDFTETLLVVNPDLSKEAFPAGYPLDNWRLFESEINGDGRVAFVYYVDQAGFFGVNSNFIGIDSVKWVNATPNP